MYTHGKSSTYAVHVSVDEHTSSGIPMDKHQIVETPPTSRSISFLNVNVN